VATLELRPMAFGLSQHHSAHTSDARCVTGCNGLVASGGRDSKLKLWLPGGEAYTVQEKKWVNAVTWIAPGRLRSCMHGGIVTGSQDGLIRIYSLQEQQLHLKHALLAHNAPVCSLSLLDRHGQLQLLSGGWDAVAKVWEVQSAEGSECPVTTLSGHENNVCVIGLANGHIITGSSGVRDQNTDGVTGFQLRVWQNALIVQRIAQDDGGHAGAIRDLAAIRSSAFASASNDGTVSIWNLSETDVNYVCAVKLAVPSESFVFSLCYVASTDDESSAATSGTIFTGDDSGELCVFDLSLESVRMPADGIPCRAASPVQRIHHPNSLWSVAIITAATKSPQTEPLEMESDARVQGNHSVATACADGVVRIFSADQALQRPLAEQQKSLNPPLVSSLPAEQEQDFSMSTTLPRSSERGQFSGPAPGAISLFLDDEAAGGTEATGPLAVVAFRWPDTDSGDGDTWVKLGPVLDPVSKKARKEQQANTQKQELDGELFDHIIPVEVDSVSQGELSLLLGVNVGDDPRSVAAKFCQKHGLMDEYIPQIAMFVEASV